MIFQSGLRKKLKNDITALQDSYKEDRIEKKQNKDLVKIHRLFFDDI